MSQARIKIILFYLISVLFILLNAFILVKEHSMIINALPLAFIIILLAVFAFDKLLYLVIFFTPLSLPLSEIIPGLSFNMFLPTEPLLLGILLIFILKTFSTGKFDRDILTHPVSLAIYLALFWLFVTSLTSTMPIVSLKFFLSRIWFIVGFYLLTAKLFESGKNIEKFVWLYTLPLLIVIFYATYRHLGYGLWDKQAAHFVVDPFYNDHTAYGAAIAMYLPFLFGFSLTKIYRPGIRIFVRLVLGILLMGLILSYARAAWISMIAALVLWIILRLKIRFKPIFIGVLISLSLILVFQHQILMNLEQNNTESSANLGEHVSSITNISSDASNMERINRWSCAIRMFEDKPIWGWGPGTYMFNYAPYQLKTDRTIISTNSGNGGNAHSEYLGPMAESGFMGLITFLILIAVVIYTAVHTYSRTNDKRLKTLVMSALLGLTTYYIHGTLNNFLDSDKLSVPFWGFTAIIVAVDIYTRKESQTKSLSQNQE
ncbi:MAG TPA: O-antigen ligase family protein [Prolixibacteraceae bacterium]|nr:O-antigen ligase family protein [Prolixibacteraceae bacterium]